MNEAESHSVTDLLRQLREDDPRAYHDAAARIWAKYLGDLLALARRHLAASVRRRADEEDVLQSMFASFCARQRRGGYELGDRRDLWRLLVAITENKARSAARRHGRGKRDYRREARDGSAASAAAVSPLAGFPDPGPTPDEAAVLVEELQLRLASLEAPLRQLTLWKLAGYTHEEIAGPAMMNCAVRTVERKLAIIRQVWEREMSNCAMSAPLVK